MATEEEVAAAKAAVLKLRAELQSVRLGKGRDNLAEATNDIHLAELGAEAARLTAEIAAAKAGATKAAAHDGAAVPLGAAKEGMARAVAAAKAHEKPARPATTSSTSASTEGSGN